MKIEERENSVFLEGVKDFEPVHIFDCGQCFRWDVSEDGSYTGVAGGKAVNISKNGDCVTVKNTTKAEFEEFWSKYLDLDFDYGELKKTLSEDEVLAQAIKSGEGIRILNQDLWECIISFIISANNNIPRIKRIIKIFCEQFGDEINFGGEKLYTFPSAEKLSGITIQDIKSLRAGYRDKYLIDAIEKVNRKEIDLKFIKEAPYNEAKKEIMKIKGIGNKVADCILLFGAGKKNAFPVDVWIKRVMETLYKDQMRDMDISSFVKERFGEYGGYAQQYLFYHMREISK